MIKKHENHTENLIKEDLTNSSGGIRLFQNNDGFDVNEITKNIVKYAPSSIILKVQALKEFGKTPILLEIERQLAELNRNPNNPIIQNLTLQLRLILSANENEFLGDLLSSNECLKYFNTTLMNFSAQISRNQKIVLCLEFEYTNFIDEFMDFIRPLIENLPNKLFIYIYIRVKDLDSNKFKYKIDSNYYWNHPTDLGSDLYFLSQNNPSLLIEHVTSNEISLLLRLWNLSDLSIPIMEKAIQFIPEYSHQEVEYLLGNEEFRFTINNTDKHEAEYKLYRELAFHYSTFNNLGRADYCRQRAFAAIEKSMISNIAKIKYKGLIWGDYARFAKGNLSITDSIKALIMQKTIYQADKDHFIYELSTVAHNLGVCYRADGKYKKAIGEFTFSLNIAQELNNQNAEIETRLELGRTYLDFNDYKIALFHFETIKNLIPYSHINRFGYIRGVTLAYIATIKQFLGDNTAAYENAKEAIAIFSRFGAERDKERLLELFKM